MSLLREIRKRSRKVAPQVLGACLVGYFAFHAIQGDRGIKSWVLLNQDLAAARQTEAHLADELKLLEKRVSLLRPHNLDRDMLEERARLILNFGHEDDVVVLLR